MTTSSSARIAASLIAVLLLIPGALHAEGYAGSAGAFLRMGAGPAALATGDAGVARAFGAEQANYNPAGLPFAPGNEIWFSWHKLSLDRKLVHIGALYQVKSIALWGGPVRPVVLVEDKAGGMKRLVYPNETRARGIRTIRPDDYLETLADAALTLAGTNETPTQPLTLVLEEGPVDAGSLAPLVRETTEIAKQNHLVDRMAVLDALRERYQRIQERPAAVSLNWTHAGTDNIDSRDYDGNLIGSFGWYENRFSLAFGLRIHHAVSVGVSAGVLYALVPDLLESGSLTSTTFIADAGVQIRPFHDRMMPARLETLTLGVAAFGLGAKNTWNTTGYWSQGTTKNDNYPNRYRFGAAWKPVEGVAIYSDVETDLKNLAQLKSGVELTLIQSNSSSGGLMGFSSNTLPGVMLRAGLDRDRPTFGLGLELKLHDLGVTRLDYAYVSETISPEATQVISWRFQLMH
ncbi:MAG: hypothetical protein V2A56_12315 [bacterium]